MHLQVIHYYLPYESNNLLLVFDFCCLRNESSNGVFMLPSDSSQLMASVNDSRQISAYLSLMRIMYDVMLQKGSEPFR